MKKRKTLLILRHAKSIGTNLGFPDHDRPLDKHGRRDAARVGLLLSDRHLTPDLIISSTAVRARCTVEKVMQYCGFKCTIRHDDRLYLADSSIIIDVVQSLGGDASRLLIVAHNPGLKELIGLFTGQPHVFPTGALAQIDLSLDTWSELRTVTRGRIVDLWQ